MHQYIEEGQGRDCAPHHPLQDAKETTSSTAMDHGHHMDGRFDPAQLLEKVAQSSSLNNEIY